MKKMIDFNPAKVMALSFLSAIAVGTLLLMLPGMSFISLSFLDALFMATSAICVTGLSVIDVGMDLTFSGQLVLISLIQIGGLGIMTFSVFFMLFLGVQTSYASRLSVGSITGNYDIKSLVVSLFYVISMTFTFEAIGAACLYLRMSELHPPDVALFHSIFHSISAFCNAGFSLYEDSLERFQKEFWVPSVVMVLIFLGGIGFPVMDEIRMWLVAKMTRKKYHFSLYARICLIGSFILIAVGAIVIWLLEIRNLMAEIPLANQWMNSLFFSVTARTAGFNTFLTASLTNGSLFFLIFLMFVGGCPGSAAGGIKVSTFAVIAALILCHVRGRPVTSILKRRIPSTVIGKALGIFAASFILINVSALLLQITESHGVSHQEVQGSFLDLLFEATSAFGTVGLSAGVTPALSAAGKSLIIFLMFAGRVGPLTLGMALLGRKKTSCRYDYPEAEVMVG